MVQIVCGFYAWFFTNRIVESIIIIGFKLSLYEPTYARVYVLWAQILVLFDFFQEKGYLLHAWCYSCWVDVEIVSARPSHLILLMEAWVKSVLFTFQVVNAAIFPFWARTRFVKYVAVFVFLGIYEIIYLFIFTVLGFIDTTIV